MVDIVIVNYNTCKLLKPLIESIEENTQISYELYVVDNNSTDGSTFWLRQKSGVNLIVLPRNMGYAYACNRGIENGIGDYIVLMNSDLLATPGWLEGLLFPMEEDGKIAICSPLLVDEKGKIVGAGTDHNFKMRAWGQLAAEIEFSEPLDSLSVSGACFMLKRSLISTIGYLDERYFFYFEDLDYCFRAQYLGYRVLFCPGSQVIHFFDPAQVHGGSSGNRGTKQLYYRESEKLFNQKWSYREGVIEKNEIVSDNSGSQ